MCLCWLITKVKEGVRVLTAQLLRATKFFAVPSKVSSKRSTGLLLSLTTPSERQISPATMTSRLIEVQKKRETGRVGTK